MVIVHLCAVSASGTLRELLILSTRPSTITALLFNSTSALMDNATSTSVNDWLSADLTISLICFAHMYILYDLLWLLSTFIACG